MTLESSLITAKKQKVFRLRSSLKGFDLTSIYKELTLDFDVSDFNGLDLYDLQSQAILARVLTSIGCHATAMKIITKVKNEIHDRFDKDHPDVLYIESIGSSVFFHAYMFEEAQSWVRKDAPEHNADLYSSQRLRSLLYSAFIKKRLDDQVASQLMSCYFKQEPDNVAGCALLIQELTLKCWFDLEEGLLNSVSKINLIKSWDLPHFIHKHYLFMAKLNWDAGHEDLARANIDKAQKLCSPLNVNSYLEILFYKSQIDSSSLEFLEKVLLKTTMTYSPYSYLFGNRYLKTHPLSEDLLRSRYIKKVPYTSHDCDVWVITKNDISLAKYAQTKCDDQFIDLVSGAFSHHGQLSWLSKNRANCLMAIISGSFVGVPEELIAEKVYQDDQSHFQSVRGRVRDMVTQLINSGIVIKRAHRHYLYDFNQNDFTIIFPRDHHFKDKLPYLKKFTEVINTESVSEILQVKNRTASELIKLWKMEKFIGVGPSGRYGDYKALT